MNIELLHHFRTRRHWHRTAWKPAWDRAARVDDKQGRQT